jgi:hypothetical protein
MKRRVLMPVLLVACLAMAACSPKKMGLNRMADALSATASAYSRDDDPEFVRLAAPSTLKMVEMLLDEQPAHAGLLITASSGFTEYAYAFLQVDAEILEPVNPSAAADLRVRASKMYDRARDYGLRALDARHAGLRSMLAKDPKHALASTTKEDVPAMYWTAMSWGGSASLASNPLAKLTDLVIVRALLTRALELDETWEAGALHEAMIAVEGVPALAGGSPARARTHFDRAVAISGGQSAFAYTTMATSVALAARDRAEFERLLKAALAVDVSKRPELRLENLVAQRRAKFLLSQINKLF